MIPEDKDLDPEDPDRDYDYNTDFTPLDRKAWRSDNPMHVIDHDRAQEEFEARRQSRVFMNQNTSERRALGVTKEVHVDQCTCSYCGNNGYDRGLKLGLNIPPHWNGANSWYVWRRKGEHGTSIYYRTTWSSVLHSIFGRRTNQAA